MNRGAVDQVHVPVVIEVARLAARRQRKRDAWMLHWELSRRLKWSDRDIEEDRDAPPPSCAHHRPNVFIDTEEHRVVASVAMRAAQRLGMTEEPPVRASEVKSLDFGLDVRCLPCAVGPEGAEKCWVTCVAVGGWGFLRLHQSVMG